MNEKIENGNGSEDNIQQDHQTGDTGSNSISGWPGVGEGVTLYPENHKAGKQEKNQDHWDVENQPENEPIEKPEMVPMETPEKPLKKKTEEEIELETKKEMENRTIKRNGRHGDIVPGLTIGNDFGEGELKCMLTEEQMPEEIWKNSKYHSDFPRIAYLVLSSAPLRTKAHLAVALSCSKTAITTWIRKHEMFRLAVEKGLAAGEQKFRKKCQKSSFEPSSTVNNGLIKMLGGNVYGIKDDTPSTIVLETSRPEKTVDELMEEMGIPTPSFDSPSMYDQHPNCDDAKHVLINETPETNIDPVRGVVMSPAIIDKPNTVTQDEEDHELAREGHAERNAKRMRFVRKAAKAAREHARRQGKPEKEVMEAIAKAEATAKEEWKTSVGPGRTGRKSRVEEIKDNVARKLIKRLSTIPFEEKDGKKIVNPDVPPDQENLSTETKAKLDLLEKLTKKNPKIQGAGTDFDDADIVTGVNPFGSA